ncbi:1303_t:CDS:2 [Funneliformis caledonium]|uniref:1303_t:CDS:1 n=1 Tax=Funneliformis caledonium TaxID=1117310 RepID=A0A9N9BIH4_9GLOM|nr:1303_t:CDS:2 [Funneliformis caledonium]
MTKKYNKRPSLKESSDDDKQRKYSLIRKLKTKKKQKSSETQPPTKVDYPKNHTNRKKIYQQANVPGSGWYHQAYHPQTTSSSMRDIP